MDIYDLRTKVGETFTQVINIKDSDGNAVDLSGQAGTCQIRKAPGSAELIAECVVVVDGSIGRVTMTLDADDTAELIPGVYAYDLFLDNDTVITYYIGGKFVVEPSVSVRAEP